MDGVTKDELMATVRADRARFDAILQGVATDLLEEPILPGGWSVKDVLAHIAWGDREGVGVMRSRALVGSKLWERPQDERNEIVVRESRSRSLDEVMTEYRSAFADFMSALDELTDDDLNDAARFRFMQERVPGWRPWRIVYDPGHYDEHGRAIVAALESRSGGR